VNAFGWDLPFTDSLLDISPYAPLEAPEESVAERLLMLAHLSYDSAVWGSRLDRYWDGLLERIEGAVNSPTVKEFWQYLSDEGPLVPLRAGQSLHEKNQLCRPATLSPAVEDRLVLATFRAYPRDLVDRTRMWNVARRAAKADRVESDSLTFPHLQKGQG